MKFIKTTFLIISLFFIICYVLVVVFLPLIFNTSSFQNRILSFVSSKYDARPVVNGAKLSISPLLTVNLDADKIEIIKNDSKIFNLRGLDASFSAFNFKNGQILIDEIYIQKNNLHVSKNKDKPKTNIDILKLSSNLPEIKINRLEFKFGAFKEYVSTVYVSDLHFSKNRELSLDLNFTSLRVPDDIHIFKKSVIHFDKDKIFTDKLEIYFGKSLLNISGILYSNNGNDFLIKGKGFPARDIKEAFVLLNRYLKNKKHFIENFRKFRGNTEINLQVVNGNFEGSISVNELSAITVPLSVPMHFKNVVFNFENKDVFMHTNGKLGSEDVSWNFLLTGLLTDNLVVSGDVKSVVSNNFAKTYIDKLSIKNTLDLSVEYLVQNGVVGVIYTAKLPVGSDVSYYGANLGLADKNRIFQASTRKEGDKIELVEYSYSAKFAENIEEDIISGYGSFEKLKGKYTLTALFAQTMKNAPVTLLGFLDERLDGGHFNGNLEYNFKNDKLLGSIVVEDTRFNGFDIKNAAVFGNDKSVDILSVGAFKGEPFTCDISLENSINDSLLIYKLDLYLKKFVLNKGGSASSQPDINIKVPTRRSKITAKNISLRLDEFLRGNLNIKNITLNGKVENNIFNFSMPNISFADGRLSALGCVDFNNYSSKINFSAENIDANIAAYQLYNLNNQIVGKTNATLFVETVNMFKDVSGYGEFRVKEGYLPEIGSTEFVVKRTKKEKPYKFSISDIVRIHKSVELNPKSTITGRFKYNNHQLNDINLYAQNDAVSIYAEGDYNADTQYVNLRLFGKYDKKIARNITIFHIPLSWLCNFFFETADLAMSYIDKFKKTPDIKAKDDNSSLFEIVLTGNLNDKESLTHKFLRAK